MTTQLPSKERLAELVTFKPSGSNTIQSATREEWQAMARALLAAYEQEPAATLDVQSTRQNGDKFALILSFKAHKLPDDVYFLYAHPAPSMPADLHPDTQKLVADFSIALAEKLYKAQLKYGYSDNWTRYGWAEECLQHFHQHISKGDPRDVAAYCAFMWFHGWSTALPAPSIPAVPDNPPFAVMQRALDAFYAESDEVPENQMLAAYRVFRAAMLNGGKS